MYKKYLVVLVLIVNVLFVLTGCSYVAYKDYYSSIDNYTEIWELTGFNHGYDNVSPFFPESIDNLDVKDFFCRYDQQLPLGEGIQVFLKIQYTDENLFDMELENISSMSFNCNDYFKESGFSVYATHLGRDFSSQYALIDEGQRLIYYIYLQNIPENEIEFPHQFLPTGYTGFGEVRSQG